MNIINSCPSFYYSTLIKSLGNNADTGAENILRQVPQWNN